MDRILTCLTEEHDLRLVVVAGMLCLFACYTAFGLLARALQSASTRTRTAWTCGAATVAGCGVWATHFVAMLAFRTGLPLGYDVGLTAASVAVAVVLMAAAFALATAAAEWRIAAGVIVGLAIGAMHFVGMEALRAPAALEYDPAYTVVALAAGVLIAPWALKVGLRRPGLEARAFGSALLAVAICSLHFIAMAAVRLSPDPAAAPPSYAVIEPEWLALAVAAAALLIIALGLVGSILDEHLAGRAREEAERLRLHVAELEATKVQLEATAAELKSALLAAAAASEAKSRFVATMSHELRTPLNAILGFAELIAAEVPGEGAAGSHREYAQEIGDSGRLLLGLVNDILDYSKLQAGGMELSESSVDVSELLEAVAAAARPALEAARLTASVEVEREPPQVRADDRRLRQALGHLLSNAVKFTAPGGAVRISSYRKDGGLAIAIADTGVGIARARILGAWEQFGQIDGSLSRRHGGVGLGLPLSRKLAELHGGTLSLESAGEGQGATAVLWLPPERLVLDSGEALRAA